jgi:hypothetical protein
MKTLLNLAVVLLMILLVACGGGTHGDPGPLDVHLLASKYRFDSGDRTEIQIYLSNPREEAFAIKVSIPTGLAYIVDSSYLEVNDRTFDAGPTNNDVSGNVFFLVYYLELDDFRGAEEIKLGFELVGVSETDDGRLGVDVDLDDPDIKNSTEFDATAPRYTAMVEIGIDVE